MKAKLNQVDTYSEFLNILARQRRDAVKDILDTSVQYNVYREVANRYQKIVDDVDALIRDVLKHIETVNDLVLDDLDTATDAANPQEGTPNE